MSCNSDDFKEHWDSLVFVAYFFNKLIAFSTDHMYIIFV